MRWGRAPFLTSLAYVAEVNRHLTDFRESVQAFNRRDPRGSDC
jgi:hypothetical protein